ncbi:ribose 5-phosphate isomerase A [Candidatus Saccharibacteria bacterium]|nr:ribose 5-phosphate isomerase A [Candidatus Saccharibacteria bacterium]
MKNPLLLEKELWGSEISNRKPKWEVAQKIAKRLKKGDVVGIGSGSTSFLTLVALVQKREKDGLDFSALSTSIEIELTCKALGIPVTSLRVENPNWSFDGADEVDPNGNMIKGRGGAMFREKMLMKACSEIYIAIDKSKLVKNLGEKFAVPVEVHPDALNTVQTELKRLKPAGIDLRQAVAKDGPVITENGNLILDVKFNKITDDMEQKLKSIVGVIETGLFIGYKPKIVLSD